MRIQIEFKGSVTDFTSADLNKLQQFSLDKKEDFYEIQDASITKLLSVISELHYTGVLKLSENDLGTFCRLIIDKLRK